MWPFHGGNPLRFEKRGDGAHLVRYSGKEETVDVPAEYEGLPVVAVNNNAFYDNTAVKHVTLPEGLIRVGINAFRGCRSLETVHLPSSLVVIGDRAFASCPNLTAIEIPEGVAAIPVAAFHKCVSLRSVRLPSSVTKIGEQAFEGCASLNAIDLSRGVSRIAPFAFRDCGSALCAIFPEKLEALNEQIAAGCDRIYVRVPGGLKLMHYTGHEETVFLDDECEGLPVVELGPRVFEMFAYLREIRLPRGLIRIGEGCFIGCSGLRRIDLPETLTEIGAAAFALREPEGRRRRGGDEDEGLTELCLPAGLQKIGDNAFFGHVNLKTLTFAAAIPQMGSGAFAHTGLQEVCLPSGTTEIQSEVFGGCRELRRVSLPETLEAIWEYAFFGCEKLREIALPERLEVIGAGAFAGTGLTRLRIPAAVREINPEAFSYCTQLNLIDLPAAQTRFRVDNHLLIDGQNRRVLFALAGAGERVEIPSGIEEIGDAAFAACESVSEIVVPAETRRIGRHAFAHMPALKTVTCLGSVPEVGPAPLAGSEQAQLCADPDTCSRFGAEE